MIFDSLYSDKRAAFHLYAFSDELSMQNVEWNPYHIHSNGINKVAPQYEFVYAEQDQIVLWKFYHIHSSYRYEV